MGDLPDELVDAMAGGLPAETEADLARVVESARRSSARIRYGSVVRVGVATVVLNPDSPLAHANYASGLDGTPAEAQLTLASLPRVFAEAGRLEVVVVGSPASLPELPVVAEEAGYVAVDEGVDVVLTRPEALDPGEPGTLVRPAAPQDEPLLPALLADGLDLPRGALPGLTRVLGHRLDDPRVSAYCVGGPDVLDGVVLTFAEGRVGLVEEVVVAPRHRHRGLERSLVSAAASSLWRQGAVVVAAGTEATGRAAQDWSDLGFFSAYETTVFTTRV